MKLMSDEIGQITLALSNFQRSVQNASKNKKGHTHTYAELSEYLNNIREPLAENKLAVTQLGEITEDGHQLFVTLVAHESGQWFCSKFNATTENSKNLNGMQSLGSTISYLRRYQLAAALGLGQEDDDGSNSNFKAEAPVANSATTEEKKSSDTFTKNLDIGQLSRQLVDLCKAHNIDAEEFAKYHKIERHDALRLSHAVKFFEDFKKRFLNQKAH